MRVTCEQCQFSAEVPDSYAGKTIKCPKCGAHIVVAATETFALVEDSIDRGNDASTLATRGIPNKSQSSAKAEEDVETLRLQAGALELTTRHLRGQLTMRTKAGADVFAYETRHETLDTLLSNITGFVVTKAPGSSALFAAILFVIATPAFILGIIMITSRSSSGNEMAPAFLIGGVIATFLGIIIPKSIDVVELQIMGNSKIIRLSGGEEKTRTRLFIKKVMAAKKSFEATL